MEMSERKEYYIVRGLAVPYKVWLIYNTHGTLSKQLEGCPGLSAVKSSPFCTQSLSPREVTSNPRGCRQGFPFKLREKVRLKRNECEEAKIFPWKRGCATAPPYICECYPRLPKSCPKRREIIEYRTKMEHYGYGKKKR